MDAMLRAYTSQSVREAEVDHLEASGQVRGGWGEVGRLGRAHRDGEVRGQHRPGQGPVVDTHAGGHVDGHHQGGVGTGGALVGEHLHRPGQGFTQGAARADAGDPVDPHPAAVGQVRERGQVQPRRVPGARVVGEAVDPHPGRPRGGQAGLVGGVGQEGRVDGSAAGGEQGARVQRVAPVVARTHQ